MSEESKENPEIKKKQQFNDLLMKPFSLGWTREVVKRVVTHNKTPNCDIYYFSPNKKKLRSLTEVKNYLTDGLSPECFSFKREPLGLGPDLETVRDAKTRGKVAEKDKEGAKVSVQLRNTEKPGNAEKPENTDQEISDEKKTEVEKSEIEDKKPNVDLLEKGEMQVAAESKEEEEEVEVKQNSEKDFEPKSKRTKPAGKENKENSTGVKPKNKTKTKRKSLKSTKSVELQSVKKRKTVLKRIMSAKKAKQAKVVSSKKILKPIVKKKVASSKQKLSNSKKTKKAVVKNSKGKALKLKTEKKPLKNNLTKMKNEVTKGSEINHGEKSAARDLKSIVKKNIGKYREMREKQKLGAGKNPVRNITKKLAVATVRRSRSEPISKNKSFYLKPLQKGWRRELVFRTNCAKAGQQADVYYFHPSGKKLRSCREVAENLTHGLSLECFTFRKEPIGCGEPSEVIRNARSHQKN